jgi:hypothetical protein
MANYLPKGRERMRTLGQLGGMSSGEIRRQNAFTLKMANLFSFWFDCQKGGLTDEEIIEGLRRPDARGGSHEYDWRCPGCHHVNSEKRRMCAKCEAMAPENGRQTRKALRERAEEHKVAAILKKHEV